MTSSTIDLVFKIKPIMHKEELTCCRAVTPDDQPGNVNSNVLRKKTNKHLR